MKQRFVWEQEHMNNVIRIKSLLYTKYAESNNIRISRDDFRILDKGFTNTVDRKLAEALYVKEMDPILNRQKKSYKLLLFN